LLLSLKGEWSFLSLVVAVAVAAAAVVVVATPSLVVSIMHRFIDHPPSNEVADGLYAKMQLMYMESMAARIFRSLCVPKLGSY